MFTLTLTLGVVVNPNPNPHPHPNQASPEELPPVWAVDMLGFGHTEKPGLSYTQHLWEAQVAGTAQP